MIDGIVVVVDVARQAQHLLLVDLLGLLSALLVLNRVDQLDAEQLLDEVLSAVDLLVLGAELERILEGGEQVRVALLGVLLLVVPVVIRLVELRVDRAEGLHETHRGEGLSLEVQAGEELLGSFSQHAAAISESLACSQRLLIFLQCFLKLVNPLETLDSRVHIARVAQVFQSSGQCLARLLMKNSGALLSSHIFYKLHDRVWLLQLTARSRTHHHELSAIGQAQSA